MPGTGAHVHTHRDTVSAGLRAPTWDARMRLRSGMCPPTGAHRHTHTHTHTHRCPKLPSCTRRHKRDQDTPRSTWNTGHRATEPRASSCPSPALPEGCGHRRSPPRQPPAAQPYLSDLPGSWDPGDPNPRPAAEQGWERQPDPALGLDGTAAAVQWQLLLLLLRRQTRRSSLVPGAGGGEEAAAPEGEGPCRMEEAVPGWMGQMQRDQGAPLEMNNTERLGPTEPRQRQARTHGHRDRGARENSDAWTDTHTHTHTHTHTRTHRDSGTDTWRHSDKHTRRDTKDMQKHTKPWNGDSERHTQDRDRREAASHTEAGPWTDSDLPQPEFHAQNSAPQLGSQGS